MKRIGAALLALMMLVTAGEAFAADTQAEAAAAPEWADVKLNSRGFIDEGEYVFEDGQCLRKLRNGKHQIRNKG